MASEHDETAVESVRLTCDECNGHGGFEVHAKWLPCKVCDATGYRLYDVCPCCGSRHNGRPWASVTGSSDERAET